MSWISLLALFLPGAIQMAETLHGPGTGQQKLATVVSLAQGGLALAAATGKIPIAAATNVAAIAKQVSETVEEMKGSGKL